MKKSLIALAVAGAMTAPMVAQADATLYGSFRAGLAFQDNRDTDLRDETSRVGIKGDVDLGLENTKGLFHWEGQLNTTDDTGGFGARLAYLGATGDWGTALVGRQYHPHYTMVVSHTNIFNSADFEFGEAFAIGNGNQSGANHGGFGHKRNNNTVAYASPVMAGFQVVAGAVIAGGNDETLPTTTDTKDFDGYNIAAEYTGVEGLRVSASYGATEEGGAVGREQTLWGLGASYSIDALTVAARYEDREIDATTFLGKDERTSWELAAAYAIGATTLKARYGDYEIDSGASTASGKADGDQWALEVEHKLGQKGRVWVGYTDINSEIASQLNAAEDTLVLGYRLDF